MKRHRFPTEMQDDVKIYCMRLMEQGKTLLEIAWTISRDHSTVMYNLKTYADLYSVDKMFRQKAESFNVEAFERRLKAYLKKE